MSFEELLFRAKQGDQAATEQILGMFRPMLLRYSLVNGRFDEDLYHELIVEALKCIHYFRKLES